MKNLIAHLLHANSKWLLIAVAMLACTGAGLSISFPTLYGVPILAVVPVIAWMIRKSFSQARTSPVPNLSERAAREVKRRLGTSSEGKGASEVGTRFRWDWISDVAAVAALVGTAIALGIGV